MYCPKCGQERTSQATSFCSRCGYLLTGTAELLQTGGAPPPVAKELVPASRSPRSRGIKKGLFILLLALVMFPIIGIISVFGLGQGVPWPAGVVMFLLGGAGLLRIAYAFMFESRFAHELEPGGAAGAHLPAPGNAAQALPPEQSIPASDYIAPQHGNWRDTKDLEPRSVTEGTTKLLEKESEPPE